MVFIFLPCYTYKFWGPGQVFNHGPSDAKSTSGFFILPAFHISAIAWTLVNVIRLECECGGGRANGRTRGRGRGRERREYHRQMRSILLAFVALTAAQHECGEAMPAELTELYRCSMMYCGMCP